MHLCFTITALLIIEELDEFWWVWILELSDWDPFFPETARCLKITVEVSFNIVSEASYVYILSGQKLIENAKNGPFWRVFENLKLVVKQCYQTGQFK